MEFENMHLKPTNEYKPLTTEFIDKYRSFYDQAKEKKTKVKEQLDTYLKEGAAAWSHHMSN